MRDARGSNWCHRRDLLPDEASHPRASALYHKIQLGELRRKDPPILNPTGARVAFIYTTWDRFSDARVLADLYSEADQYVDRVFHALEQSGMRSRAGLGCRADGSMAAMRSFASVRRMALSSRRRSARARMPIPLAVGAFSGCGPSGCRDHSESS